MKLPIHLTGIAVVLLLAGPAEAADLFYKKTFSLYVIHDVDQGNATDRKLDTSVGKYSADGGAVVYLKGSTLHVIPDTRNPVPVILTRAVADFEFRDGVIAYSKDSCLYVRLLSEDVHTPPRRVLNSYGVSGIYVAGGTVVFLKNKATLYRVTNLATGESTRVIYPAGYPEMSGGG